MAMIKQHLELLAEDSFKFLRLESNRGMGEWSVNYKELGKLMKQIEVEKVVEERFGGMGTRLLRIIKEKGRVDEKQVSQSACSHPLGLLANTVTDRDHCAPEAEGDPRDPQWPARSWPPRAPGSPQDGHAAGVADVLPLVLRRGPRGCCADRGYLQGHVAVSPAHRHGAREAEEPAREVGAHGCAGQYGRVPDQGRETGAGYLGCEGREAVGCCAEARSHGVDYEGFLEGKMVGNEKWTCAVLVSGLWGVFCSDCFVCERRVDHCLAFSFSFFLSATAVYTLVCTLHYVFLAVFSR